MIDVEFDLSQLHRMGISLGAAADQMPYVMARTLNDAAESTRTFLIGTTWSSHVTVRNRSFISAALTTKGARATKTDLVVEIYDKLQRANLQLHAKGGTRRPHGGAHMAVPIQANVKRTARGVRADQRPNVLARSFRIGDRIFQRQGTRKTVVKLMYSLRSTTPIPKDVPFYEDFAKQMQIGLRQNLARNVVLAMATRRG
jgi:hypothetical protein